MVHSSAEFRSFLLSMCIEEAQESTTNDLSCGFVKDGAGKHQTSDGEKNAALSFSLSLCGYSFGHFPRDSADASILLQGFFLRSVFKCWSIGTTLVRIRMLKYTLGWTLSFPIFSVA